MADEKKEEVKETFEYSFALKDLEKVKSLLNKKKISAGKNKYWDLLKKTCSHAFGISHEFTESDLEDKLKKSGYYDESHQALLKLYSDFSSKKYSKEGFSTWKQFDGFLKGIEIAITDLKKKEDKKHKKREHVLPFFRPIDAIEEKIEHIKEKHEKEKEKEEERIKKELEKIHQSKKKKPIKKQFKSALKSFLEYEEAKFKAKSRRRYRKKKAQLSKLLKLLFLKNKALRDHEEHIDLFNFNVKEAILGKQHPMVIYNENRKLDNDVEKSVHFTNDHKLIKPKTRKFLVRLNKKKLKEIDLHENEIKRRLKRL